MSKRHTRHEARTEIIRGSVSLSDIRARIGKVDELHVGSGNEVDTVVIKRIEVSDPAASDGTLYLAMTYADYLRDVDVARDSWVSFASYGHGNLQESVSSYKYVNDDDVYGYTARVAYLTLRVHHQPYGYRELHAFDGDAGLRHRISFQQNGEALTISYGLSDGISIRHCFDLNVNTGEVA